MGRHVTADRDVSMTRLTTRQKTICAYTHRGMGYKEIAWELRLTESSIRNRMITIRQKLGVATVIGVALYWERCHVHYAGAPAPLPAHWRDRRIFELLHAEKRGPQIAKDLGATLSYAKLLIARAYQRAGVKNRIEAALWWERNVVSQRKAA